MHRRSGLSLAVLALTFMFTSSSAFAGSISIWGSSSSDPVFNFDTDAVGKATTFTDTVGGLSATFSSSGDPGGFAVESSFFDTLTGNVLVDPGPANAPNLTLSILFSAPVTTISMDFATNSAAGVPFDLSAFNGTTGVGSTTATGSIPGGFAFPEGVISFSGATFNRVVLSVPGAPDFAIDNVSVTTALPEPGSISLLVLGVGAIALAQVRRLRRG